VITRIQTTNPKPLPPPDKLEFGKHFSDHWFVSKFSEAKGWHDSAVAPMGPISLHPGASVFHYGQALFEGMKAFRQKNGGVALFRPEFNYHRMREGAERLCLQAPPLELFIEGVRELVKLDERWVPHGDNTSLYIRPTLIGTEAFLGVRPSKEILFYVLTSPAGSYYAEGSNPLRIWVEETYLRAAPGGLGATKAGANYAASLKAAVEAKKKNYSQVLWLDTERKCVEEVGTMNIFFVFKDEVVTPSLDGTILAGNVRDSVLHLLRQQGRKVSERRLPLSEVLEKCQAGELLEAFGTGTAAVISPVGLLHARDRDWEINGGKTGPVAIELLKTISGIQRGTLPDTFGWMSPCN